MTDAIKTPITETPRADVERAQRDATSALRRAIEDAEAGTRKREAERDETLTRPWDHGTE